MHTGKRRDDSPRQHFISVTVCSCADLPASQHNILIYKKCRDSIQILQGKTKCKKIQKTKDLLNIVVLTLLNGIWTNRTTSFFDLQWCFTKQWWASSLSAFRFAITSTITGGALISLPQLSLSVILSCHCVVTFAG